MLLKTKRLLVSGNFYADDENYENCVTLIANIGPFKDIICNISAFKNLIVNIFSLAL